MSGFFDEVAQPDLQRPNIARVYDYMLGGNHNFQVDREFAARMLEHMPRVGGMYASNRAFLGRVVRHCVRAGVDQFLDLGSGIPTMGNVHEIARSVDPAACVAYVDREPVAVAHGEQILSGVEGVSVTGGDIRDPAEILSAPGVRGVLDFDRPVAVLMVAVLHFVSDDEDPAGLVAAYRSALAPGSMIAVSHGSADLADAADRESMIAGQRLYRGSDSPIHLRDRHAIASLIPGLTLVDPGVVELRHWRPEPDEPTTDALCGGYGLVATV